MLKLIMFYGRNVAANTILKFIFEKTVQSLHSVMNDGKNYDDAKTVA